jgi:hypothetical protein
MRCVANNHSLVHFVDPEFRKTNVRLVELMLERVERKQAPWRRLEGLFYLWYLPLVIETLLSLSFGSTFISNTKSEYGRPPMTSLGHTCA